MSSDEDTGNYDGYDGYDDYDGYDGYDGYDDAKEVVRTINDVCDEDEEYKLLKTRVRNLEMQMSALVKRVHALQLKVVELGGTPYDENDYPEDDDDIANAYDENDYPEDDDDIAGDDYVEDEDYDEDDDYDANQHWDQYADQNCECISYCPHGYCHCHCA